MNKLKKHLIDKLNNKELIKESMILASKDQDEMLKKRI